MADRGTSPIASMSAKWFELLLVMMVLVVVLVSHHLVGGMHGLLHFYYLPVAIAAYYFGRKLAGTTALFAFLAVTALTLADPDRYTRMLEPTMLFALNLCVWGGFLGLSALLVGTLCDQRAEQIEQLRQAHVGIVEILVKYLQSADRYTKSHSLRVAELSEEIATEMGLSTNAVDDVRVGALLHDIGKVEISTNVIQKAAKLSEEEWAEMTTHTFKGAELVRSLGSILSGAVPLIQHHHDWYVDGEQEEESSEVAPLGARIIAVADAYDAIVTDRPYRTGRTPIEAVEVIREGSGKQFDPAVVRAFERVMVHRLEEQESASKTPVGVR